MDLPNRPVRSRRPGGRWLPAALGLALVLGACGGSGDGSDAGSDQTTTEPAADGSATADGGDASTTTAPAAELPGSDETCGGIDGTTAWLEVPDVGKIQTATIGEGDVVAILLHQSGREGMCGAVPYAEHLAQAGARVVLLNQCGYGASECGGNGGAGGGPKAWPTVVAAAVAQARSEGATRVTLVGASAGGTLAVATAGTDPAPEIDALVDLSGPLTYGLLESEPAAPQIDQQVLLITAPEDRDGPTPEEADALLAAMPSTAKEVVVATDLEGVHGWNLLRQDDEWTAYADAVQRVVLGA